ncbi:U3 small nucleolar RNA-associated protein 25 [Elysia marginata]|uniref:U3 small nucleolar RNA-associated protein 25 homolog n=1 Tax=Elysia marginata TaxID=1093978 RepID=A0AAV4JIC7_9GAST|nr:U3 small nucleolar RNA-associated protein 25 [Elysia marginata]
MAPKRQRAFGGRGRGKQKKKKFNLITLRQRQDIRQFGELHPVDSSDNVKTYTKVTDESSAKLKYESESGSSSEESESEMPAIKELMAEIGMKQEDPESEQDSEEESEEDNEDVEGEDDDGDNDEEKNSSEEEQVLQDGQDLTDDSNDSDDDEDDDDHNGRSNLMENKSLKEIEALPEAQTEEYVSDESAEEMDLDDENEIFLKESDPFTKHFEHEKDMTSLFENNEFKWKKQDCKIPTLGDSLVFYKYASELVHPETCTDLAKHHVKKKIFNQAAMTNSELAKVTLKQGEILTPFQRRLFSIVNSYQDILYPKQTHANTEEIRLVYCMHALNHVLKTRARIIAHNFKIKHNKNQAADDDIEYRDQGLTRPKVLIVLPYRNRALKVVNLLISLLFGSEQANVSNRKRFEEEYSELEESGLADKAYKTEDFKKLFEGNTDDNFRIGLSVSKKSLRLYSPFYESDIILASPLGLRMIIGLEGDKEQDFDFLSSIEVMIADQMDVFLMQNWDHFLHTCKHMHMQPREPHGVDFSRVRMWSIDGWSKHFRQTLMFSSVLLPEILTIFNKHCHNYTGKVLVQRNNLAGTIKSSVSDAPQIFHRISCGSPDSLSQRKAKFEYLKKKVIPYHTSAGMKQTLIFCNYFSFVHLRNYFRESEIDYLFMNEYDTEQKMRNTRIHFRKRHPHFMLYTERLHFHYRFRLRGIHHIVWFDLPQYPHFYSEIVNLMETSRQACTTTALFTRYEAQKLAEVVGSKQAALMVNSEKAVNMITVS